MRKHGVAVFGHARVWTCPCLAIHQRWSLPSIVQAVQQWALRFGFEPWVSGQFQGLQAPSGIFLITPPPCDAFYCLAHLHY